MEILRVAIIAIIGALAFQWLSFPIPWMLGPLFAVLIAQFFVRKKLVWPPILRNIGLVIVGVAIGQAFDLGLFTNLGELLLYMVVINVILIVFCIGLAWVVHKMVGIPFKTAVASSVPGGLSQFVLFAEEEGDVDLAVVTFYHVIRIVAVVMFIPFLVSGHIVSEVSAPFTGSWWLFCLLLIIAGASVFIGKRLHLPVPQFLSPIVFIIIVKLFGVDVPEMPVTILHGAQLLIGAYIGLLLKPHMIKLPLRVLVGGVASTLAMVGLTYLSSLVIARMLDFSFATSFLSTAPGGLDQMGLLASAVGADISVVTVFQLFRLLFIFLVVLPLLKWFYRKRNVISKEED